MIALTLEEVAAALGGALADAPDPGAVVSGVVADSRDAAPGDLFVAIRGQRVDGHDFVPAAMASGAVGALVERPTGQPSILVDDTVGALGRLARYVVERLPDLSVVAVTGSSGKTSTKDLVAQVAALVGPTVAPPGSYNTEVGLPLTVLRADRSTRVLVLEMGARGSGHIAYLCGIAAPHIGVVLNVGLAHVGEFGSVDAVADAKAELVEHVRPGGLAVLNADDVRVAAMAARSRVPVVTFGRAAPADVVARDVSLGARGRPSFTLGTPEGDAPVRLGLTGIHQVDNALAAAAVGRALGLDVMAVAQALDEAVPRSRWRMEVDDTARGVTLINDSYNANPDSVQVALEALIAVADGRRTWAVLGEMLELGAAHDAAHEEIGRASARLGVHELVVVGPGAAPMLRGSRLEGSPRPRGTLVDDVAAAEELLLAQLRPGDVVLVKASRSVGLESLAAAILRDDRTGGGAT